MKPVRVKGCTIKECPKPVRARELCAMHYSRLVRNGSPSALKKMGNECQRGHKFTEENTIIRGNGRRYCRQCKSLRTVPTTAESRARYRESNPEKVRAIARAWRDNHPEIGRSASSRRRAITLGREAERFTHIEIFERDGWVCGICNDDIDSRLTSPAPMSASLDHIIPLSKDGHHTRRNVQASHLRCNLAKGARIG